ncbi:hypothetical protein [Sphingomonas palmae]|uniref:hypothetical protein n=1 Tax=Sphingomonas palmae TaxID=1855283 RepID=UPI00115FBF69|nr:hypothetical protein [Sphingomonas palmae]
MKWCKILSVTDAQQPTSGRIVPYLRFIKGNNPQNNQTWFRQTFFGQQNWTAGFFGNHPVEECYVDIDVTICGSHKGSRKFHITHDSTRMANNSTPNTWLHYDNATLNDFSTINTAGLEFCIEYVNGTYKIDIN